ncbi:hypothetical protein [Sphingomonas sp. PAMC 26605]|uniref:hypothetical protein n=1 Tax=Sphingomonas sp. PAMC 26605 TaxID=1112214 RepID=UPI0012F497B3|nr:hypothetical protein [Sphingomonas sp. PAMC 26605]
MGITLKEASEQVGVTRQTLMKAIKNGRVSGQKSTNGEWRIEPVELFRVWPAVKGVQHPSHIQLTAGDIPIAPSVDEEVVTLLKAQIDLLRSQLDDVRTDREDVRADRNHWRQIAERALLTDQRTALERMPDTLTEATASVEAPLASPPEGGFWSRLFGRSLKDERHG